MLRYLVVVGLVFSLSGCCALSRRSCFPACPPPKVVEVTKCKLPGPISLRRFEKKDTCPKDTHCFDNKNMFIILERESKLKDWVKEARNRCSPPTSAPSTQPTP